MRPCKELHPIETPDAPEVSPGPNRFCLSPMARSLNARWAFAIRYYDRERKRLVTDEYAADTRTDLEHRRTAVLIHIRNKGLIPCECGCDFMGPKAP
ncbi:MAG: hypothetical protein HQL35_09110 [Alphaproteobacteria bacterium]|nr:hypothetical protein [Alphaproteobacteria bacterium]